MCDRTLSPGFVRSQTTEESALLPETNLSPEEARRAATSALWTFPAILSSAFIVAWAAEAAQFYVSQGLALALLAWVQVLPEFAVEATIAWHRDIPLMTANFTGALRLLTGLGWPTIWIVHALARRARGERDFFAPIRLDREHAVEVVGLVPALVYFGFVIAKGSLSLLDAGVLLAIYAGYLWLLNRMPPKHAEDVHEIEMVPRFLIGLEQPWRTLAMGALFVIGAALLWLAANPFLHSMIGLAAVLGVSQFVFVQWVAPFLSELPEFITTTYWARGRDKGGMALMNMASSNINQWTVLAAMIPIAYSMALGHPASVPIAEHRVELLLTLLQGILGVLILANFDFHAYEATGLFALWLAQFLVPHWREPICWVYATWIVIELASTAWRRGRFAAFGTFVELWREGNAKR
jgi:cation:H+ antiporter